MAIVTGAVEAVSTKFDKFSVLVNGTWYGTKAEWATVKPNQGDTIQFDDGGKKYFTKVKITGAGTGAPAASVVGGSAKSTFSRGAFPIAPLDGQRSIIRQNAVTNANTMLGNQAAPYSLADLLGMAREIEGFTAGDIDRAEAEDALAAMSDTEH